MRFSRLGERLTGHSGTLQLMEDLGAAMATDEPLIMLGGGNPARIDAMSEVFAKRMAQMAADSATFERVMGVYDGQCGDPEFLSSVARLLNREFHWPVTEKNIAVTNGSQNAFFYLFNLVQYFLILQKRNNYIAFWRLSSDIFFFIFKKLFL